MVDPDLVTADGGTDLGRLSALVGYHLRRATHVFAADFARTLAGTDMRQVLFGVLSIVDANTGINQGAAGRVLGIQRANMASLVTELVDRGWIERRADDTDRRALSLSITPAGRSALAGAMDRILPHEDRILAELDAGERATLLDLLRRIGGAAG